jgi:hypothetical protein
MPMTIICAWVPSISSGYCPSKSNFHFVFLSQRTSRLSPVFHRTATDPPATLPGPNHEVRDGYGLHISGSLASLICFLPLPFLTLRGSQNGSRKWKDSLRQPGQSDWQSHIFTIKQFHGHWRPAGVGGLSGTIYSLCAAKYIVCWRRVYVSVSPRLVGRGSMHHLRGWGKIALARAVTLCVISAAC